jgi:large subunit ribosomal protein L21
LLKGIFLSFHAQKGGKMYAIVEIGAKQFKIKEGDIIEVEKQVVEKGKEIALEHILLMADADNIQIGQPYLNSVSIKAEVLGQIKADKVVSFKYRRRKSSHTKKGHRQQLTRLKIKKIALA